MACRNRQLGLILLKEVKQASKSKFKLWIESLPSEVPTLMNWSQKELQQLQMDTTSAEKDFLTQVVILDPFLALWLFRTSCCRRMMTFQVELMLMEKQAWKCG